MGTKLLKLAFFATTTIVTFAAGVGVGAIAVAGVIIVLEPNRTFGSQKVTVTDKKTTESDKIEDKA